MTPQSFRDTIIGLPPSQTVTLATLRNLFPAYGFSVGPGGLPTPDRGDGWSRQRLLENGFMAEVSPSNPGITYR